MFAVANIAFSLADAVTGHVDKLPTYLREGTLDAFLLRPLPVLAQLVTSDISLRRLGRAVFAVVVLVIALTANDIDWTPANTALPAAAIVSGTAIFAALFVCAAAVQFWLVEGGEFAAALAPSSRRSTGSASPSSKAVPSGTSAPTGPASQPPSRC